MHLTQVSDLIELMRMEYAEIPELKLTFWQAQRLWNIPGEVCERALASLIKTGFLARTGDGLYVRRSA
jgi:hypothetical protein